MNVDSVIPYAFEFLMSVDVRSPPKRRREKVEELKEERNRPPKRIVFFNNDVYEGEKKV